MDPTSLSNIMENSNMVSFSFVIINIFFRSGRSVKNKPILLQGFHTKAIYMVRDLILHKGHPPYKKIGQLLQSRYIGSIIGSYVSAKGLSSHHIPHLIEHKLLKPNDRKIWTEIRRNTTAWRTSLPGLLLHRSSMKNWNTKYDQSQPWPFQRLSLMKMELGNVWNIAL